MQDATGALRNPYEVLKELAERWSSLTSDVKAAITTALAGTRQQDIFASLMNQFGEATSAMEAMADSAGALSDAYGIFEDSMQGHINTLKAAFEELSMAAIDKGLVNSFVDMGTALIEVLTPVVKLLGQVLSFLGPIGTGLATIAGVGFFKNLDKLKALFTGGTLAGDLEKMSSFWKTWNAQAEYGITPWQNLEMIIRGSAGALGTFVGVGAGLAAVGGFIALIYSETTKVERAIKDANKATDEYNAAADNVNSIKTRLEDVNSEIDAINNNELSIAKPEDTAELERQRDILERQLEIAEKLAEKERKEAVKAAEDALEQREMYFNIDPNSGEWIDTRSVTGIEKLTLLREHLNKTVEQYNALLYKDGDLTEEEARRFERLGNSITDQEADIALLESSLLDLYDTLSANPDLVDEETLSTLKTALNIVDDMADTEEAIQSISDASTEAASSVETFAGAFEQFDAAAEKVNKMTDAYAKLADGSLELKDVVDLVKEFPELAEYVDLTADNFGNLDDGLRAVARSAPNELIDELMLFAETADLTDDERLALFGLADALGSMPTGAIDDVSGEFISLQDEIMGAKQALSELEAALQKDPNEGYEKTAEGVKAIMELFDSGAVGTNSEVWDIAEAIGYIGDKDPAKLWAWVEAREAWYNSYDDNGKFDENDPAGIQSFMKYVNDSAKAQEWLAENGGKWSFDGTTFDFDLDNAQWSEFASVLGLSASEFTNLMTQAGRFYEMDWEDINDIADYMDAVAMSTQSTEDRFKQLQDAAREALQGAGVRDDIIDNIVSADGLDHWTTYLDTFDDGTQRILRNLLELKAQMSALGGGDPPDTKIQIGIEDFATVLSNSGWSADAISSYVSTLMDSGQFEFTSEGEVIADTSQADEAIAGVLGEKAKLSEAEKTNYSVVGTGEGQLTSIMNKWSSIVGSKRTDYSIYQTTYKAVKEAKANGTAHASGNWGTRKTENALTGELGPELIVDGRTGRWYTVGDRGAEFVNIPKGSIVFNHKQTEDLLKNGYVVGRGQAMASGTAYLSANGSSIFKRTSSTFKGYSSSSSSKKKTSSSSSGSSSSSKSSSSSSSDSDNWFEKQYAKHQHLLAMEQESMADYLTWLDGAFKKAYKEGIITLEDYYKYEEEVFNGLRDDFEDFLGDIEHEVSMRQHFHGEAKTIRKLLVKELENIEAAIAEARAQGLTDDDEYMQQLQDLWWDTHDEIVSIDTDYLKNAKDSTGKLVDIRKNMLKQDIKDEQEANKAKLKSLKEFYQKQKDLLKDAADEDKYLKEQTEKRKKVTDLEAQLDALSLDNSAKANKKRLELEEELAEAREELNDFEKDHALEVATEQLDEMYEEQEKAYNDQNDLLDLKLQDERALYLQALDDVRHGSKKLYNEMIEYNAQYGSGIDQDITDAWEAAYAALWEYTKLNGEVYDGFKLKGKGSFKNVTGWDSKAGDEEHAPGSWNESPISDNGADTPKKNNNKNPKKPTEKTGTWKGSYSKGWWYAYDDGTYAKSEWKTIGGKKYHFDSKGWMQTGWKQIGGSWYYLGTNGAMQTGWVKIGGTWYYMDKNGKMVTGTQKIDGKSYTFNKSGAWLGYASGTKNAKSGLHRIDEHGDEFVFESANGNRYRLFSGGEKVLNAKATDFLYKFATSGGEILTDLIRSSVNRADLNNISNSRYVGEINMGDIIINGNADQKTVSQIRREQREGINYVLTQFAKLSR